MKTQETQDDTSHRVTQLVDEYKSSNLPVSIDSEPPPLPGSSGHQEPAPAYDSVVYCRHGSGDSDTLPSVEGDTASVNHQDRVSEESAEFQQTYFGAEEHETNIDATKPKSHPQDLNTDQGIVNKAFSDEENQTKPDSMDLQSISSGVSSIPSVTVIVEQRAANAQAASSPVRMHSLGGHDKKATSMMQFWVLVR